MRISNQFTVTAHKLCAVILLLFFMSNAVQAQPPSHDPSTMIRNTDGRYWIFTTGDGVWTMSSSNANFTDWRAEKTPYTKTSWPSWIRNYVSGFAGTFWAPEVINVNGEFRLYYSCSTFGSKNSCIGLATATNLSGPWTDRGVVVSSNSGTSENAIDAAVYANTWLVYGSFFGGIRLANLSASSGKPLNSTRTALASGDAEAPYIMKNGSYYYLFINRGACCRGTGSTTYRIQVGRSTSITGPYLDKSGRNMNSGGGSDLVVTTGRYIGPGHFGFGNGKVTYHFYDGQASGAAKLRITTLSWSNGWPVVSGSGVSARMSFDEEIAEEELSTDVSEVVSMAPNPVRENILGVTAHLEAPSQVYINMVNLNGQEVYMEDLGIRPKGELRHEINVSSITKGSYVVRLNKINASNERKTVVKKITIE
jgi:arabinan endo-1,5-alpha-L-arabinosidase